MNNELQREAEKINRDCLTFPNVFMAKIENEISHINRRLDNIPTKSEMLLVNEQMLERVLEKADTKYAPKNMEDKVKWLEKVIYTIGGACCLFIFNGLLKLL